MDGMERQIVDIKMEQLTDVDNLFGKHAQVDMDNIPEKYKDLVYGTKEKCVKSLRPAGIVRTVEIKDICDETITMADNGETWTVESGFIAEILKTSRAVVWFAATLRGFEELSQNASNFMEQFFLDAWGSAFASRAGVLTADYARNKIESQGLHCTSAWNPGQHSFDISNQKQGFDILRPSDIDLTLTPSMLMIPAKSVSGLFGVCEEEDLREVIACDYCRLREKCPSAYNRNAKGGMRNDTKFCGNKQ